MTPQRPPGTARHLVWVVPAAISLLLSASMIGRTTLGRDEMATWQFANLPLTDLFEAVRHVDGVLAPYYLLMNLWSSVDDGAVWLRLPSALAVSAAVAVAARLGHRAWGPGAGLLTGMALALHPVVIAEAVEARPYGGALLLCTIGTAMVLADAPLSRRRYVLVMGAAVALHLFALAVVVAHLVIVRRRSFLVPAAAVGAIVLPIALVAHAQRIQVSYILMPTPTSTTEIVRRAAVPADYLWMAAAAVVAICVTALLRRSREPLGALGSGLALTLIPPTLLVTASHLLSPVLNDRYLVTAPLGVALVIGSAAGLVRNPHWLPGPLAGVLVVTLVATTAPAVRVLHAPRVKGADFPRMAQILAHRAQPGDGLQVTIRRSQGGMPAGVAYYTGDRAFLADVLRAVRDLEPLTYERRITGPGASVAEPGLKAVQWLVSVANTEPSFAAVADLQARGCRIVSHHRLGQIALHKARCPVLSRP